MKKLIQILIIAATCCCIGVSCEKYEDGKPKIGSMEDLLGTYTVTVEDYVIWGGDSGTIHDKGTITITKIDKKRELHQAAGRR